MSNALRRICFFSVFLFLAPLESSPFVLFTIFAKSIGLLSSKICLQLIARINMSVLHLKTFVFHGLWINIPLSQISIRLSTEHRTQSPRVAFAIFQHLANLNNQIFSIVHDSLPFLSISILVANGRRNRLVDSVMLHHPSAFPCY
jgi:hypothetical protein